MCVIKEAFYVGEEQVYVIFSLFFCSEPNKLPMLIGEPYNPSIDNKDHSLVA